MAQASAVDLFRQAMTASRAGDKVKTRELLREAVKLDPNSETTWQWLATVCDKPLEATAAWERVLALNPNNDKAKSGIRPVRLQAGIEAAKSKDIQSARRLLRAVVADDPRNEHGWLWLASVSDSPTEAKAHLERVLFLNPQSVAAKKGIAYYDKKISSAKTSVANPAAMPLSQAMSSTKVMRADATSTDTPMEVTKPDQSDSAPEVQIDPNEPKRVLVVDGSRTQRKLLGMLMAETGFALMEAEDVDEAIDRIRDEGAPTLVFLDSRLEGIGATDFCRLLRQHPDTETLPVVLMAPGETSVDRAALRKVGFSVVVQKPLQADKIVAIAEKCRVYLSNLEGPSYGY
jgi:CheY-like chemotaxis protein